MRTLALPRIPPVLLLFSAVAVLTAALRIPSFFEPHWYGDEGIFAAVARQLLDGQPLYDGVWDHKPPLIYFLYSVLIAVFGYAIVALRVATTIAVIATEGVLFAGARPFIGSWRATFACLLLAVLMALPSLEGQLALTEVFMSALTASAFMLYVRLGSRRLSGASESVFVLFGVGALFGLASGFKPVALADAAALLTFIFLFETGRVRQVLSMLAGFVCVWLSLIAVCLAMGSLPAFFDANFLYQVSYVESSPRDDLRLLGMVVPPLLALGFAFLERRQPFLVLAALWLGFAIAGAMLGGFPFSHYLIQVYAPLTLVVAGLTLRPFRLSVVPSLAMVCIVVLIAHSFFRLMTAQSLQFVDDYYSNFVAAVRTGERDRFNDVFTHGWWNTRDLVTTMENAGAPGQSVLLWGEHAWSYSLADIHPVSRFLVWYHVYPDPKREREAIEAAKSAPAQFIVIEEGLEPFPGLQALIEESYNCDIDGGFTICRLAENSAPIVASGEQESSSHDSTPQAP